MLDGRLAVRRAWVRSEMTAPKSSTSRRVVDLVPDGRVMAGLPNSSRDELELDGDDQARPISTALRFARDVTSGDTSSSTRAVAGMLRA